MSTTNELSRGSRKIRISQPLLDRFEVRKLESRTLPRALRAIAEWSDPCGAGRGDFLQTEGLQDCLLAPCVLRKGEVSLEGLLAREHAPLFRLGPARARAVPNLVEVAHAVLRTHVRVFEGQRAGADAAIRVLLGVPSSLTCGPVFVRFCFLGLLLAGRKI